MKTIRVQCNQVIHYDSVITVTDEEHEVLSKLEELDEAGTLFNADAYEIIKDRLEVDDRSYEEEEYNSIKIEPWEYK